MDGAIWLHQWPVTFHLASIESFCTRWSNEFPFSLMGCDDFLESGGVTKVGIFTDNWVVGLLHDEK